MPRYRKCENVKMWSQGNSLGERVRTVPTEASAVAATVRRYSTSGASICTSCTVFMYLRKSHQLFSRGLFRTVPYIQSTLREDGAREAIRPRL